jgi:hypothetical protein
MHHTNPIEPKPAKVMTSRELVDAIDQLICVRILNASAPTMATQDALECLRQDIADALKRLDHEPGVYFGDERDEA